VISTPDLSTLSSPLIDTERNLGLLLGLHASYLAMSTPLSPLEVECASKQNFILICQSMQKNKAKLTDCLEFFRE